MSEYQGCGKIRGLIKTRGRWQVILGDPGLILCLVAMKRNYELSVIFTPVLKEKGLTGAISGVESLVKKVKGKVLEMEEEGKQRLAYPIAKYHEGIYLFWRLELLTEKVGQFEKELKLQKGVLRQLLIKEEDK